jgi:hypothetical protein
MDCTQSMTFCDAPVGAVAWAFTVMGAVVFETDMVSSFLRGIASLRQELPGIRPIEEERSLILSVLFNA